jgi:hypothetical protein
LPFFLAIASFLPVMKILFLLVNSNLLLGYKSWFFGHLPHTLPVPHSPSGPTSPRGWPTVQAVFPIDFLLGKNTPPQFTTMVYLSLQLSS